MNFSFVQPWHLFLPREGGHVVGIMGSGGKTSLQRSFARVYAEEEVPTILTTTTRSEPLDEIMAIDLEDLQERSLADLPSSFFLRDGVAADGKWQGLKPELVDQLEEKFPDHVVIAEVDGAAKLPVKIHRPGEPVWPGRTSLAIVVLGAGAVGSFAHEVVHRLGKEDHPALADLKEGAILEWDHCLALLRSAGGYLDQLPPGVPALLALGGMAEVQDSIGLFDFVGKAMQDPRLPLALFFESSGENPSFRTGYRDDDLATDDQISGDSGSPGDA